MWSYFGRFLNGESKTIASAAMVLAVASLASRLAGLFRDRILASSFGAGAELDVYYAAFRLPDFVYNLLVLGALSAGFIPLFTRILSKPGESQSGREEEAWRFTNSVLNILIVFLVIIIVLAEIFAPRLVKMITPGFSPDQLQMTTRLTRIMFLSPLFLGISAVWGGVLQSFKRFVVFSLGPIFYNLGIILGAIFLTRFWGLLGLAGGVVLGAFLHAAVQIPAVRSLGYAYQWFLAPHDRLVREMIQLMVPRTLGLAVIQFNLLVMTVMASTLREGSIAIFNLASNFQSFAVGVIGLSYTLAVFPSLAEAAANDDRPSLINHFSLTARQILFFIAPASVLFLFLRAQIVRVVLGAGEFDWRATILTADTLAFFTLSLAAQALIPLLTRVFYAFRDASTPFLIGLVAVVMNIGFALWLKESLGVRGLALAFSVASWVNLILLWVALRLKLGALDEWRILRSVYKLAVAMMAMAVMIQVLKVPLDWWLNTRTLLGIFLQGLIAGLVGLAIYLIVGFFMKSEEITLFVSSLRKKFFRKYMPTEAADEAVGP